MRAAVFSGTTEGREICRYLSEKRIPSTAYVATEYGRCVMGDMKYISVHIGRMNESEMEEAVRGYDFVIDATHPYAEEATVNIRTACSNSGIKYVRLKRKSVPMEGAVVVNDTEEAVRYLSGLEGSVFISTGSKEIEKFISLGDRLYARVLDTESVRKKCEKLKIKNIIYKVPPFSYEDNINDFSGCHYLVTKDSGTEGGAENKLRAARELGMEIVLIKRPEEQGGMCIDELKEWIDKIKHPRFPLFMDLSGKKALIVGGGKIALRRINTLLQFGADIHVVAERLTDKSVLKYVEYEERRFKDNDIDGAFLAVAATDDRKVNHRIYELCREKGIPVSVADRSEESTFFFPAVCLGEGLSAGIVSGGNDHFAVSAMAEKIRSLLNENKGRKPREQISGNTE